MEISSQKELDKVLSGRPTTIEIADGEFEGSVSAMGWRFILNGSAKLRLVAWGSSQPHVEAWGSSQPHVEAWESSQPHVVAWGSSQPHVEARESSQPHVVAWGSSQPHVEAWGSSQPHVEAWGSSQPHVEAKGYCQISLTGRVLAVAAATVAVLLQGSLAQCDGGIQVHVKKNTPAEWCEYYGVDIKEDIAIVFKAVDEDFATNNSRSASIFYQPETTPIAPDWDGGEIECGKGLHFSPSPLMALEFNPTGKHFIACPVALKDIVVHPDGIYPQKIKARGLCAPCYEVDRFGNPISKAQS